VRRTEFRRGTHLRLKPELDEYEHVRDFNRRLQAVMQGVTSDDHEAYDGVEAVEAARAFRPQVIMLDIGMPRLDGYRAAREIRKHPDAQGIKLVALTGWGQDDDRRRAREAGFDAHLVKPAELDALCRVLADVAGAARA
jgi:CheY-like chemotaxis protein